MPPLCGPLLQIATQPARSRQGSAGAVLSCMQAPAVIKVKAIRQALSYATTCTARASEAPEKATVSEVPKYSGNEAAVYPFWVNEHAP